jgi:hypothetical protein
MAKPLKTFHERIHRFQLHAHVRLLAQVRAD